MAMERWRPNREPTKQEQFILKRLETRRKLLGFLHRHRHELFGDSLQAEIETMYRDTGAGSNPGRLPSSRWRCCSRATSAMVQRTWIWITLISQRKECPNGHVVGDQWIVDGKAPAGMCLLALHSLSPALTTVRFGGAFRESRTARRPSAAGMLPS